MTTPRALRLVPTSVPARRVHADRATYKMWIDERCASYAVRWARLDDYDRFVERWPSLQDWFDAPLRQRLLDKQNCIRGQHPHGGASVIMPYLTYLSLVHGVGLDYPVLLARTFTSPFKHQARNGGLASLSVSDHGPGVPPEERELIFQRFQRGRDTTGQAGFGLGLAIGRELAERMGGELMLDPGYGPGARFTLTLPVAEATEEDPVAVV